MVGDRYLTDIVYGNQNGLLTIRPAPLTMKGDPSVVRMVSIQSPMPLLWPSPDEAIEGEPEAWFRSVSGRTGFRTKYQGYRIPLAPESYCGFSPILHDA